MIVTCQQLLRPLPSDQKRISQCVANAHQRGARDQAGTNQLSTADPQPMALTALDLMGVPHDPKQHGTHAHRKHRCGRQHHGQADRHRRQLKATLADNMRQLHHAAHHVPYFERVPPANLHEMTMRSR